MDVLTTATTLLLFGVGLFFLLRLKGFYLLHPFRCIRLMTERRGTGGISPFRALTVALAGTLGVGNIVGVASALWLGGAGAVFWMLVSALVSMVLKYAEITLAVAHRRRGPDGLPTGGAFHYVEDGLAACMGKGRGSRWRGRRAGRVAAAVFALLCLLNAFTMGGFLQVNAVAGALEEGFSVPPLLTGVCLALLSAAVVKGGARRISALTERLVPFMTVGFLALSVAVLILRRERLGDALASIWREALTPVGMGAGVGGFLLSRGVRYGVMRGLVSNEAGCGTAPMAHAAADTDLPARQGLFGLAEVFVDTVLLCTVTALVILVSDSGPNFCGEDATRTAQAAFSSVLGEWAGGFFALCMLLFGAATVICWAHYGMTCVGYLTALSPRMTEGAGNAYLLAFAASLTVGAVATPTLAWSLADGAISLMTVMNLAALLLSRREVAVETDKLLGGVKKE